MLTMSTHTADDSYRTILSATISDSYKYLISSGKKTEVGKLEGEREVQQASFGVYAVYVCAIQQQFIDA